MFERRQRIGIVRLAAVFAVVLALVAGWGTRPAAAQTDSVTIDIGELNGSGVSGTATLTANGDETLVSIEVDGATGDHPAHIHEGTCDALNPNPAYPLNDVDADGISESSVPVALDELLGSEYAINVHESATNPANYVACGEIVGDGAAETAEETAGRSITIDLEELNDSGVSGTAELVDNGDGTTQVTIRVDGATGGHPAHIHEGACETLDPNPAYALPDVDADGLSQGSAAVALDELLAGEHAINVHESAVEIQTYVACGTIMEAVGGVAETTETPADGVGGTTTAIPATGVGAIVGGGNAGALIQGLGALAAGLAAGGLVLRRRQ